MVKSLIKNKKGFADKIMLLIVMAIILIGIMLIAFLGQLTLPILVDTAQEANGIMSDVMQSSNDANLVNAHQASFQPVADSLNNLEWFSYTMIVVMCLVFIIMCFYVRTYPFLLWIWIILIIILVLLSIYLAVVYQDLAADSTLGGYYTGWENTDFMLKNLPVIITIIGIVGGIIMFTLSSREQEAEGVIL